VVVNEFAGAEPSPQILDALVVYIEDIDFLPNPHLDKVGRLTPEATASQQRGEALFARPFPHDPHLSCATCHLPSATFADHQQHDIGSGGLFKTPTLLNADFNAPYFHDGRFDTYDQVIDYFDRSFSLGFNAQDRADLAAYLTAIGDGVRPEYHLSGPNVLSDIDDFASILDGAIARHETDVIALAVPSLSGLLQDLAEHYPEDGNTGGAQERTLARASLAALIQTLHRLQTDVAGGRFNEAAGEYLSYRKLTAATVPFALQAAQPWSLFNPTLHAAYNEERQKTVTPIADTKRSQN
jgi:hypothetical protein